MPAQTDACLAALAREFSPAALLTGADIPARNRQDTSYLPSQEPLAVLRPDTPEGVAQAMRICAQHGVTVVRQGGLTGLAGGSHPIAGAVMLSLERLTGIEEIDPAAMTMTVRAGTALELIQRAADDAGFFIPLDLGARGSCQIGGNLGTNAGGNRVIRYGMAREMVLGLEYVLPDGTLVTSLNKMIKNNAGYDLKQLFIGSEGTLGIITRAVLRMQPRPGCVHAAPCGLDSYGDVAAFWATRDACSEFGSRLGAHVAFDIGLPVARMDEFVQACRASLSDRVPNAFSVYYGHIGDGNLHLVALSRGADRQPMSEISAAVYETVRAFGGTISAEHGIGTLKKPYLGNTRSPQEIALMRKLKAALDPQGILNLGKVFDTEAMK